MKISDYIIDFVSNKGVTHVFELSGGAITHLTDSLGKSKEVEAISMHHEQSASFAAEGFSRVSKAGVAVAMATSGPGATNLITGIASCYFDSVAAVFITGQVNTYEYKGDNPVRQLGFQETDIVNIVKPVVKDSILVSNPKDIRYYLEKAFYAACSGRKGPVLLDIPMDVQRANVVVGKLRRFSPKKHVRAALKKENIIVEKIRKNIGSSKRPVFLLGGGVRTSGAAEQLAEVIKRSGIPVVSSLPGLDAFPHDNRNYIGMIGTYGQRYSNIALASADLVIILGSRLDSRQIGTRPELFAKNSKVIRVDVDTAEMNNNIKSQISLNMDIKEFVPYLSKSLRNYDKRKINNWTKHISDMKKKYPVGRQGSKKIDPNMLILELSGKMPADSIISVDVGQNQMWSAQSLFIRKKQRFITESGMGAMGSALPMAIGAALADAKKHVTVIAGDGGFQLNIQELQTVVRNKLPVKILIINNHCYGMVRQFQKQYFDSKFYSTDIGYSNPDFVSVAKAYKMKAKKVTVKKDLSKGIKWLYDDDKPKLLEVTIDKESMVLPKLGVNRPIEEQEPGLSEEEKDAIIKIME